MVRSFQGELAFIGRYRTLIISLLNPVSDLNQTTVETGDQFDKAKEEQDQLLEDMVPKMNKEATKLVEVYDLTQLIGKEVLDSLKGEAITLLKTNPNDLP